MRVRRKFIKLTKLTYPHGTEYQLKRFLPNGYQIDEHGNYFLKIGDKPTTMFTCHLDTACVKQEKVTHVFYKNSLVGTDGKTILGADDKAGMVVLLSLIEKNVPGLYYFFIGEEVGCVGSSALSLTWGETEFSKYITKCVSFDRRGTDSVITDQLYGRCASDEFATDLSNKLNEVGGFNFSPDPTGVLTDSVNFMDFVPECTNISVGYYNEHGGSELQDLSFLKRLCNAVCEIDWESLAVVRDPISDYYYDLEDEEEEEYDPEFTGENYSYFKSGDGVIRYYISNTRIKEEISLIYNWLQISGAYPGFDRIDWNGNYLSIGIDGVMNDVGERYDLLDMIPGLREVPKKHLKEMVVKQTNNYLL